MKPFNRSHLSGKGGFTLVETLVVMGIILLLTTIALSSSKSSSRQLVLYKNQAVMVGFLNRAKALAAEKFNADPLACAFGVHFTVGSSSVILFQDLKSASAGPGCKNSSNGQYKSDLAYEAGEELSVAPLDQNISLAIKSGGSNLISGDPVDVIFIPPELMVTSTEALPLVFGLKDAVTGSVLSTTLDTTGQINTQ